MVEKKLSNQEVDKKEKDKKFAWWQPAVKMSLRFSGWIVFPVLIAMFLGHWLDDKYNTEPWMFLIVIGLAFIISMIGLIKSATKEFDKISPNNSEKDKS